jgi:transposase, IS30 family
MKKSKKLSKSERSEIEILKGKGYSLRAIAKVLGRSPNTICYEVKRCGVYNAKNAHLYAREQLRRRRLQWMKIEENQELKKYIEEKLKEHWNPDEISGSMKKEKKSFSISKNSIYRWLYSSRGQYCCRYLYSKRYRKKLQVMRVERVMIPNRIPLDKRFLGAANRSRYGHIEIDAIVGRKGTKGGLSVIQERKSRIILAQKVETMSCFEHQEVQKYMIEKMKVKSATFDNGIENKEHQSLSVPTFFCDPYSSWQKGGVENGNKMIRRYFPKGTNFDLVTQTEVDYAIMKINKKPRKILGYKSALEVALEANIIKSESVLIQGRI